MARASSSRYDPRKSIRFFAPGSPMFDWLNRLLGKTPDGPQSPAVVAVMSLNALANGGRPRKRRRSFGNLPLPSGVVTLFDPGSESGIEFGPIESRTAQIECDVWEYPSGATTLGGLELIFDAKPAGRETKSLGKVGIDSARIAVADRDAWRTNRQETGPMRRLTVFEDLDRDGIIRKTISQAFDIRWRRSDDGQYSIAHRPVEAKEFDEMKRAVGRAKKETPLPIGGYIVFGLNHYTASTSERFVEFSGSGFLPIGKSDSPQAFVAPSGAGDGSYEVLGQYDGPHLRRASVTFLDAKDF